MKPKLREFEGFFEFWKHARNFYSLGEAVDLFHNNRCCLDVLDRKLAEKRMIEERQK